LPASVIAHEYSSLPLYVAMEYTNAAFRQHRR
jgi:hypothetical protein